MLNSYAAVLEAAFPERRTGLFRAVSETKTIEFSNTVVQTFNQTVLPGTTATANFSLPVNTVQASVSVGWGLSPNDLALSVKNAAGQTIGASNYLNLTGLTGRREKVNLYNPAAQNYQASVSHTGSVGTAQNFYGQIEAATVDYNRLSDLNSLSNEARSTVLETLRSFVMIPQGKVFRPSSIVTRAELAATFVRSGNRLAVRRRRAALHGRDRRLYEKHRRERPVQRKRETDLRRGARRAFRPDGPRPGLIAAVALVKAANYDNFIFGRAFPAVADYYQIPAEWRPYAAVALRKGF